MDETSRAALETWLGPIQTGDGFAAEADLAARLGRLVSPDLVALEVLLAKQSEMTLAATKVAADDVRSDHTKNLEAIGPLIDSVVYAIESNTALTLGTAGEALIRRAKGGEQTVTSVIEITASNRRPG